MPARINVHPAPNDDTMIPWPGGKSGLRTWVIGHLPPVHEYEVYAEPFGGSASILLAKPRSPHEFYNDANLDVVNFMTVVRDQLPAFLKLMGHPKRPMNKETYDALVDLWKLETYPPDPIQRALDWFYVLKGSHSASWGSWGVDPRNGHLTPVSWAKMPENPGWQVMSSRLQGVEITGMDVEAFIDYVTTQYPGLNTLWYCDPPYLDYKNIWYSSTKEERVGPPDGITENMVEFNVRLSKKLHTLIAQPQHRVAVSLADRRKTIHEGDAVTLGTLYPYEKPGDRWTADTRLTPIKVMKAQQDPDWISPMTDFMLMSYPPDQWRDAPVWHVLKEEHPDA